MLTKHIIWCAAFLLILPDVLWAQTSGVSVSDRVDRLRKSLHLSAEEATQLETAVAANDDDSADRELLLGYYFYTQIKSHSDSLEAKREQLIFWFIENAPASEIAGQPEAEIIPNSSVGTEEGYARAKQLWLEQTERHPKSPLILFNAATFLLLKDLSIATTMLEKAHDLDPANRNIVARLALAYDFERRETTSSSEESALAHKVLALREQALAVASNRFRLFDLPDVAEAAFAAGEFDRAQRYASEFLEGVATPKYSNEYGLGIHRCRILLGLLALNQGHVSAAKEYLLDACHIPADPLLLMREPDFTLAQRVLENGDYSAVIAYLDSCAIAWPDLAKRMHGWAAIIREGGVPNFSSSGNQE